MTWTGLGYRNQGGEDDWLEGMSIDRNLDRAQKGESFLKAIIDHMHLDGKDPRALRECRVHDALTRGVF